MTTMGFVARKPRHRVRGEIESDSETVDTQILDDAEVIQHLESDQYRYDGYRSARGLAYGIVFGAILWALVVAAYFLVMSL